MSDDRNDLTPEQLAEIKQQHVINAADAREAASEGDYSFLRSHFRRANPIDGQTEGEVFEIPHYDLFDAGQQERWDALQDDLNNAYDRQPDVMTPDGKTLIAKGQLIYPHKKDGVRLRPWSERIAVVLWDEDGAARAKAGGINLNEIEVIWAKQRLEMEKRTQNDSKSSGRGSDVAPTSN